MRLIFLILVLIPFNLIAQDYNKVKISSHALGQGLYMLVGAGGNMGLSVGQDGAFLIDDQFAPLHGKIVAEIKKHTPKPIKFVINTHWHGDHTGGNENMGKAGAIIVAHENVRERMSKENFRKILNKKDPPAPKSALPTVTFPDKMSMYWNGQEIKISHFASSHTDGDSVIYFPNANVIHTGDIFFNGFYPYIDVSSGGSLKGIIASVEKILEMIDNKTKIIPGHGPLATKKDLQIYLQMLKGVDTNLGKLLADGKSVEQVVAMKPLSQYNKKWGQGFMKPDVFTRIAYTSLKTK